MKKSKMNKNFNKWRNGRNAVSPLLYHKHGFCGMSRAPVGKRAFIHPGCAIESVLFQILNTNSVIKINAQLIEN